MATAYTIGNTSSYDQALAESAQVHKLGRDGETALADNDGYPGGWVWKAPEEAHAFIVGTNLPFTASVYELELPNGWEEDVNPIPGLDGVHNLIHDALIIRKV